VKSGVDVSLHEAMTELRLQIGRGSVGIMLCGHLEPRICSHLFSRPPGPRHRRQHL